LPWDLMSVTKRLLQSSLHGILNLRAGSLAVKSGVVNAVSLAEQSNILHRLRAGAIAGSSKGWLLLSVSIALELMATTFMKIQSETQNRWWNVLVYTCYFACFGIFPYVLDYLPLGVAYATWSGVGTAATVIIQNRFFGESLSWRKLAFLVTVMIGIIGLNIGDGPEGCH
jgi:small multidrug resistance pump